MTKSRISMAVAAAGLVLVGLLAAALFSPSDNEPQEETTAKDEEKIEPVKPKQSALQKKLYETDTTISYSSDPTKTEKAPDTKKDETVDNEPAEEPATTPEKKQGGIIDYTIKSGDMISKLAVRYGCKSTDIYRVNDGLSKETAHKIRVGQVIRIPVNGEGVETVSSTSTSSKAGKPSGEYYPRRVITAEQGDTAFSVAIEYYGARALFRKVLDANPELPWSERLKGGEQVVLPEHGDVRNAQVSNTSTSKGRDSLIPPRR